jgi:hypothetical protein
MMMLAADDLGDLDDDNDNDYVLSQHLSILFTHSLFIYLHK